MSGMPPDHSQTLLGDFCEKLCFAKNVDLLSNVSFCKKRPHMAALGEVLEAKCSYFDAPFFHVFTPPCQNIALYLKILICGALFLKKHFFVWSLP